jgi:ketosteroid isomerase-like protein
MASHTLRDNPESVRAIEAVRARWPILFNSKRIVELCDHFYATDGVCIPPDHEIAMGRPACVRLLQGYADLGDVTFRLDVIETHADDTTGYLIGNYVFYDRRGSTEVTYEGRTLEAYRKEADGSWKCSVDMWHHLDPSVIKNPMPR